MEFQDQEHKRIALKSIRLLNIKKFRKQYPEMVKLSNNQILKIFEMYKANQNREFSSCNISFLVSGTLIILITTLFMNACSAKIGYDIMEPNIIVMNTVIASAAAGCQVFLSNQYNNSFNEQERVQKTQLLMQYNVHELCGGVLAGLISISGASANVSLWAAALIGMIGSMYFQSLRKIF
jgi:ammonia channel protein AmtB